MFNFTKPEKKYDTIKPGKYLGNIASAEVGKTKNGHQTIKLKLKLEGHPGFHFVDLNMEHEKTKQISQDTISSILFGALLSPPTTLATIQDVCAYLTGLPVSVQVKEKTGKDGELRTQTYFNDCPNKLQSKSDSAAHASNFSNW